MFVRKYLSGFADDEVFIIHFLEKLKRKNWLIIPVNMRHHCVWVIVYKSYGHNWKKTIASDSTYFLNIIISQTLSYPKLLVIIYSSRYRIHVLLKMYNSNFWYELVHKLFNLILCTMYWHCAKKDQFKKSFWLNVIWAY